MLLDKLKSLIIEQCIIELEQSDKLEKIKKNILEPLLNFIQRFINRYIKYIYTIIILLSVLILGFIVLFIQCYLKIIEINKKLSLITQ
jgi:hypothetical protein